jgi:hypothetical protein
MELKRYSIWYERGVAKLFPGIAFEPCVVIMNPANSGVSLDEVCKHEGPFYPVCCPALQEDKGREQDSGMAVLAREIRPAAQEKTSEMMKELISQATKQSYSS